MADQIIDKRTVAIPGPSVTGPEGPRGLPGVNAVENDAAVAAYVQADDSATFQALRQRVGSPAILFAAADSPAWYASRADVLCPGVDDQDVIQEQIDRHAGMSMTYRFAPGTYHFHHFRGDKANTRACVRVASQEQHLVRFEAAGFPMRGRDYNAGFALTGSAVFRVEDSAFDNLNGSERVFVLTGLQDSGAPDAQYPNNEAYPGRSVQASGIGIDLPDNMHAVTCFDGYAFSSMRFTRLTAANRQSQLTMSTDGAVNNIAFRSVGTGKYPADIIMDGCIAFGHHLGFQVGGEHLIMRQCASLFCNLGYDLYPYILHGAHPFTMMQCCAEKCKRTIFFEQNQQTGGDGVSPGTRQSVNGSIIDWNEESQVGTDARWARTSGAQESWPGTFRGQVTYSIANEGHYMLNDMRIPFWNPPDSIGIHGINSRTLNTAGYRQGFIHYDGMSADEANAANYYPASGFDPDMEYRIMNQSLQPANPRFSAGQFWRANLTFRWDAAQKKFYDPAGQELVIPGALQS
jgi:hypothetical protein